jgi:hypothetical protein
LEFLQIEGADLYCKVDRNAAKEVDAAPPPYRWGDTHNLARLDGDCLGQRQGADAWWREELPKVEMGVDEVNEGGSAAEGGCLLLGEGWELFLVSRKIKHYFLRIILSLLQKLIAPSRITSLHL